MIADPDFNLALEDLAPQLWGEPESQSPPEVGNFGDETASQSPPELGDLGGEKDLCIHGSLAEEGLGAAIIGESTQQTPIQNPEDPMLRSALAFAGARACHQLNLEGCQNRAFMAIKLKQV